MSDEINMQLEDLKERVLGLEGSFITLQQTINLICEDISLNGKSTRGSGTLLKQAPVCPKCGGRLTIEYISTISDPPILFRSCNRCDCRDDGTILNRREY
jgi:hypothetical protein